MSQNPSSPEDPEQMEPPSTPDQEALEQLEGLERTESKEQMKTQCEQQLRNIHFYDGVTGVLLGGSFSKWVNHKCQLLPYVDGHTSRRGKNGHGSISIRWEIDALEHRYARHR